MPLLSTPETLVDYRVTGSGAPVTVFAHGLAGAIDETRPFGSGVHGSRAFLHFRGHGASSAPATPWTYAALAAELQAVADHVEATRGLGVSLGAGALLRAAAGQPDRFDRLVFVLPATIDQPRRDGAVVRMREMAEHVERHDSEGLAALLRAEQPEGTRDRADVGVWARRQAERLLGTSVARALRELPDQHPVDDRAVLGAVRAPALVVAQRGDDAHPASIAEELADALPRGRLAMFDAGGVLWTHRRELRETIGSFLNEQSRNEQSRNEQSRTETPECG